MAGTEARHYKLKARHRDEPWAVADQAKGLETRDDGVVSGQGLAGKAGNQALGPDTVHCETPQVGTE